jgi:hypothetical protein
MESGGIGSLSDIIFADIRPVSDMPPNRTPITLIPQ